MVQETKRNRISKSHGTKEVDTTVKKSYYVQTYDSQKKEKLAPRELVSADNLEKFFTTCPGVAKSVMLISKAVGMSGHHFSPRRFTELREGHVFMAEMVFRDPNEEDSGAVMQIDLAGDLLTYGDAYLEFRKDSLLLNKWKNMSREIRTKKVDKNKNFIERLYKLQNPFAFYRINPKYMAIETDSTGKIKQYVQTVAGLKVGTYKPEDIIHFKLQNPIDEIYGMAPGAPLGNNIAAYIWAIQYNGLFFENNATPRLHIDLGKDAKQTDVDVFIAYAKKHLQGKPHANLVTRGGSEVNPIGLTNKDMEFNEYLKYNREEIFGNYGLMPFVAGIVNKSSDPEQEIRIFKFLGVKPIQAVIQERMNKKVMTEENFPLAWIDFKFNAIDYLDLKDAIEIQEADLRNQIRTVNEIRQERGLMPVPWGDEPIIPFSDASKARLPVNGRRKRDRKVKEETEEE